MTSSDAGYDVVGFGIAAVDDIVELERHPAPDTKAPIRSIERHGGGQCTTALVAAARLGARCAYTGALGRNELSDFTRRALAREGIAIRSHAEYENAQPYYSIVLVDRSNGERTILYSGERVHAPMASDIDESLIRGSRVVLVDQLGPEGVLQACAYAHRWGATVIGDFERASDERIRQAMLRTDHLIVPLRLARETTGCEKPEDAVRALARAGRACTAATDGRRGCWFAAGDGEVRHQASFEVETVDTTGCGDIYHGAYAAAIVWGRPPEEALIVAAAAAALKTRKRGAQAGAPDRATLEAFLEARRSEVL